MNLLDFSNQYLNLLNTDLKGLNLTRILDPQEFYQKQILDSVLPYTQSQKFKEFIDKSKILVDVGFGGGFPILPLAFQLPDYQFVGFESKNKKVEAVKHLADKLNLKNVKVYHRRINEVEINVDVIITFKAVGTVANFLPELNITSKNSAVSFYKGPSFEEDELQDFNRDLSSKWTLIESVPIFVTDNFERKLVTFSPKLVPHGTIKNLVKLTDLL